MANAGKRARFSWCEWYVRYLEYGILGPLAVWRDGLELPLGSPKQRALLAVLLLHADEVVSTAKLVDELWGDQPPATAVKAAQVYVSRLRKLLGRGVVETRPTGYRLRLGDGALDLARFERLLDQGRLLQTDGAVREARESFREALGLWRGPALADFAYEAFARDEIDRLEGLRLSALELRLETDLALGRHAEAVGELEALIREYPLRETLDGMLMLALYRAGRQADALAVYQDVRARLVGELGLDPSQALQRLEKAILLQDPALDLPSGETALPVATAAAQPGEAARKVVSVVFCDVVTYGELGEQLDPEALGLVTSRSFELVSAVVESHGGAVERFAGAEMMAVFGVPFVREDDALRASRAAIEIRDRLPDLGVQARIGVSSGEVVAGAAAGHGLVAGDPVAVGRRLEEAAEPGEVLMAESTLALVGEAAEVERAQPVEVKGRLGPVGAYRLLGVGEAAERRHGMRFVGRERELATLRDAWGRVRAERRCELMTLVGDAGIGKSRLATELTASIDAWTVQGRCLPYGEGNTYWPVVEVLKQLDPARLGEPAAATIESLLDGQESVATADEITQAFRETLEATARQRPLIVVLDDIHWAEETLLDLIEHVALLAADAAILLVCLARPELVERRASWPVALRLEPLPDEHVATLLPKHMAGRLREEIAQAAGGNPLFIQEMLAIAGEGAVAGELAIPPTLRALLAARLDQLDPDERTVLGRGAIAGEVFQRGSVEALTPDGLQLTPRLASLVRKGLIRPDRTDLVGDDGFRFRHVLIRDAAYDALPKATRARLHGRFAAWLEEHATRLVSLDELVGYHLERSYHYHVELEALTDEIRALGRQAAHRLAAAGRRAFVRGDMTAAVNLLERALGLGLADRSERTRVQVDLAFALGETGRMPESDAMLAASIDAASGSEERGLAMRALVQRSAQRLVGDPDLDQAEIVPVAETAIETFEQLGDSSGLALAERLLAMTLAMLGRTSESSAALERALAHAEASRDQATRRRVIATLSFFLAGRPHGGWPVADAILRCEEALESNRDDPVLEAVLTRSLSLLLAMAGRFDEARELVRRSSVVLDELNQLTISTVFQRTAAQTKELIGDRAGAEQERVERFTRLRAAAAGAPDAIAMAAAVELANFYCDDGRWDEAAGCLSYVRDLRDPGLHAASGALHLVVEARLAAHDGRGREALALVQRAVALVQPTGNLDLRARVHVALAEVQRSSSRTAEADAALATAIELYDRRGNSTAADRLRSTRPGGIASAGAIVEATTR